MSKTLIAESIAELKELKRVTIENAKLEFAESITPQIRAILESSLAEEAEAEDEKDEIEEAKKEGEEAEEKEEAPAEDKDEEAPKGEEESEGEVDETFDIDAALAEIEGSLAESDDEDKDDAPAEDEAPEETEEVSEVEVEGGDPNELDEDYINRLLAEVEDEEAGEEEMHEASEEEEIDIAEVEGADDKKKQVGLIGKVAEILKKVIPGIDAEKAKKFEQELSNALANATGMHEEEAPEAEEAPEEEEVTEQELLESLKKEAKELNLLNSKLLFQNKLLLEGTFNDQQKANIIKALDKAKTVNEAKIVYETYKNMTPGKKAPQPKVSEQLGFRKIGVLQESYQPKTSYDPTDPVVLELQRRAGIRK